MKFPSPAHRNPPLWLSLFSLAAVALTAAQPQPPAKKSPSAPAADSSGTAQAKGFGRVEVTPQTKEQFQSEKRVAVVVAPSYRNSGLNALRYTYVDALELKAELERQGYTVMLVSPSEATSDNVRKTLENVKQLMDGNNQGTLLFAFSGHGFQTSKGNYLVTVGATPASVESEALSVSDVEKLMNDTGARRKIILVDACRNDPEAKSGDAPRTFSQFQEAEGTSIMLSTRPGGFSFEDSDLGHGIFTYYVLEALRGKAAGKDGYVTFFDLQKYVENTVVAQSLKKDHVQRPFVMGERSGDFLLATAPPPKPEEIHAPPAASSNIDSNTLVLREIGGANRAFFALLTDNKLTLVDAKTLNPFTEVADTGAGDLDPQYRHFKGDGMNHEVYDFAVEVKGNDIVGVKGRVGLPCPNPDKPCTTVTMVPQLPGEKNNTTRSTSSTVSNVAGSAKTGLAKLGIIGGAKNANKTQVGADSTKDALDLTNPLLKYQWKAFELTSNLPQKK